MALQDTVEERKRAFLQSRKNLLLRGIQPSERLRTIADDGGIDLSILKGALEKVNREVKRHGREVYSRQMIEHVVDQIGISYWESRAQLSNEDAAEDAEDETESTQILGRHQDLTSDENIQQLPSTWPGRSSDSQVDQDDYLQALTELQSLSAQRQTLQNRLTTLQTLLDLLEPFRKPKENIQPNLVWKDSPLAPELAKMRTLAIRVAGRVEERRDNGQFSRAADEEEDVDMDDLMASETSKIDKVVSKW